MAPLGALRRQGVYRNDEGDRRPMLSAKVGDDPGCTKYPMFSRGGWSSRSRNAAIFSTNMEILVLHKRR